MSFMQINRTGQNWKQIQKFWVSDYWSVGLLVF